MRFPGYRVYSQTGNVLIEQTTFDETELDPATNWKQVWENQDVDGQVKGYVELVEALISAAKMFVKDSGRNLSHADLDYVRRINPVWQNERFEIKSINELLSTNP